jgi:HEAT repeat protein
MDCRYPSTMTVICRRCGSTAREGLPCANCWEGSASVDVVRELVAAHEQAGPEVATRSGRPTPLGRTILSRIDDPEAAPALRSLLGHERAVVRGAAVRSLGFSGDSRDVVDVAALLDDEHPGVRSRARSALAELGGTDAADALFASVAALDLVERAEVQAALAWLNDPRDLDATRAAARASLSQQQPPALSQTIHQGWGAVYALLRLATRRTPRCWSTR